MHFVWYCFTKPTKLLDCAQLTSLQLLTCNVHFKFEQPVVSWHHVDGWYNVTCIDTKYLVWLIISSPEHSHLTYMKLNLPSWSVHHLHLQYCKFRFKGDGSDNNSCILVFWESISFFSFSNLYSISKYLWTWKVNIWMRNLTKVKIKNLIHSCYNNYIITWLCFVFNFCFQYVYQVSSTNMKMRVKILLIHKWWLWIPLLV